MKEVACPWCGLVASNLVRLKYHCTLYCETFINLHYVSQLKETNNETGTEQETTQDCQKAVSKAETK